jgi:Dolichyl-phosphate-mannose-protein mannosyltransferase
MNRREKALLVFIVALGLAARVYFLAAFENVFSTEAEAYSKINLVNAWIAHGKPYPDPNFGPLHTWLIFLLTLPFKDPVFPVRIFSLICGIAAIPVFFFITKIIVGKRAAFIAAVLFAFFPVHLRASATSLAEAPYALCFFGGLAAFIACTHSKKSSYWWLVLSALCFNLAGMLRFEAWLFFPVLCLFALRRGFLKAVGYGLMLLIFPAVHMYICWKTTGHPMSFGQTSAASFLLYLPQMPLSYRATAWLVCFWLGLSPVLAILCVLGMLWGAAAKRGGLIYALFFFPYALLSYRTIMGMIDPSLVRYGIVLAAIPLPLAAGFIDAATTKLVKREGLRLAAVVIVCACAIGLTSWWSYRQANESQLPDDVRSVAGFLRDQVGENERIILDKRFHPYLVVESRHDPNLLGTLRYSGGPVTDPEEYKAVVTKLFPLSHGHGEDISWGRDIKYYEHEAFVEMMQNFDPTMLVLDYESGGNMQAFTIAPETGEALMHGRRLTRILQAGEFAVFRIEHVEGDES